MPIKMHVTISVPNESPREFDLEFDKSQIALGREKGSDILIPLSTVSRKHALIFLGDNEWYLKDLNSTHGTYCNGVILGGGGEKHLKTGDTIGVIHTRIFIEVVEALGGITESLKQLKSEDTSVVARELVKNALAPNDSDSSGDSYIRVMSGERAGENITLSANFSELTIGRSPDCEFQIKDANISRRHALIRKEWDDITVEDLGSKNGLLVNSQSIVEPKHLHDGDELVIGGIKFVFIDPGVRVLESLSGENKNQEQEQNLDNNNLENDDINLELASELPKTPDLINPEELPEAQVTKLETVEYIIFGLAGVVLVGLLIGLIILML